MPWVADNSREAERGVTMDAVVVGSIVSVVLAIGIIVFLGFKINALMKRDAERRSRS